MCNVFADCSDTHVGDSIRVPLVQFALFPVVTIDFQKKIIFHFSGDTIAMTRDEGIFHADFSNSESFVNAMVSHGLLNEVTEYGGVTIEKRGEREEKEERRLFVAIAGDVDKGRRTHRTKRMRDALTAATWEADAVAVYCEEWQCGTLSYVTLGVTLRYSTPTFMNSVITDSSPRAVTSSPGGWEWRGFR